MTSVSIRIARVSDADDVARLTEELGYDVERAVVRTRLSKILARPDQQFLVAEIEGRTVAWLHAAIAEFVEAGRFAWIAGLVVGESQRRMGIGRLLVERAEEWARDQGCPVARLWSSTTRAGAHRFYERLGYANVKTQHSFAKALDPAAQDDLKGFVPRMKGDA